MSAERETSQGFAGMVQPYAFTGYQLDKTTRWYFPQARRYDAGVGRFVSEDRVREFTEIPFTVYDVYQEGRWNNFDSSIRKMA